MLLHFLKLIEPLFFSIILKTAERKGLLNQDLDSGLSIFFYFSITVHPVETSPPRPPCNSEVIMK